MKFYQPCHYYYHYLLFLLFVILLVFMSTVGCEFKSMQRMTVSVMTVVTGDFQQLILHAVFILMTTTVCTVTSFCFDNEI